MVAIWEASREARTRVEAIVMVVRRGDVVVMGREKADLRFKGKKIRSSARDKDSSVKRKREERRATGAGRKGEERVPT